MRDLDKAVGFFGSAAIVWAIKIDQLGANRLAVFAIGGWFTLRAVYLLGQRSRIKDGHSSPPPDLD